MIQIFREKQFLFHDWPSSLYNFYNLLGS